MRASITYCHFETVAIYFLGASYNDDAVQKVYTTLEAPQQEKTNTMDGYLLRLQC